MANPTTNYGFIMPSSTDLVTDLPADFDVFGQAVDTQMLTNANAAIAKAIVDAKGDLISATAADTPSRLAVGTNGQVLTADSGEATGLKWATPVSGSMTLLSTTTLNSGTTSQTISSISSAYTQLYIVVKNMKVSSNGSSLTARLNGDSGSKYAWGVQSVYGTTNYPQSALGTSFYLALRNSSSATWNKQSYMTFRLTNYNAAGQCQVDYFVYSHDGGPDANIVQTTGSVIYDAAAAVSSFTLIADSNLTTGTCQIYGVN